MFPLPVWEYVALGRHPHEGPWAAAPARTDAAIANALDRAGIHALGDRSTDELSGGEWQRVRIARALAQGGEALVLDEPTTFLDIAHEMAMFELFARLAKDGMAVLLVSHQLNLVARFADTIVLLHRGRVAAAGTPADVMRASVLEDVYEWPLLITRDPAVGAPALLPLRNRGPRSPSQSPVNSHSRIARLGAILLALLLACATRRARADHIIATRRHSRRSSITATRLPSAAGAATLSTTVITGDDLRARGVSTVLEALRETPSVAVVQGGSFGQQTSIFLRGGQSNYTQVLVDGVVVNDPGGAIDFPISPRTTSIASRSCAVPRACCTARMR